MPGSSAFSFLRTLCSLRWLAIAGQAATILLASSLLRLDLPLEPLWTGVGVLIGFNLYAILRLRHSRDLSHVTAFAHLLVDMAVLAWMVGWSGGIGNPFGMMFLILTALAALALPRNWALAAAVAGISGYVLAALFGRPLQGHRRPHPAVGPGRQLPDFRSGGAGVLDPHGGRPARPRARTGPAARALHPQ